LRRVDKMNTKVRTSAKAMGPPLGGKKGLNLFWALKPHRDARGDTESKQNTMGGDEGKKGGRNKNPRE